MQVVLSNLLMCFSNRKILGRYLIFQLGQEGGRGSRCHFGKSFSFRKAYCNMGEKIYDYPFSSSFSYLNGNLEYDEYKEGIFVGYRYFSTFDVEPLFPFGHGLSYADFSFPWNSCRQMEEKFLSMFL